MLAPMHICFIGEFPAAHTPFGGVGTFIANIGAALVRQGCTVSVIATSKQQVAPEQYQGINVYWINLAALRKPVFIFKSNAINALVSAVHAKQPIDVLEAPEAGFAFVKKVPGIKYVIRLHGGHYFFSNTIKQHFSRWIGWQEKRSFGKADACIGVSHFVLDKTSEFIRIDKHRSTVLYNPIDIGRFYAADPAKVVPGRLLFAGSLVEKKGIRQLIQAMPLLANEFPELHLEIYGRDTVTPDGQSFKAMLEALTDPAVKGRIHFKGVASNTGMPAHIEKAAICVYPSHMEAMPVAWLEVMAMAKPFIAGNPGPGKEVIEDGVDGLLCDPFDPADIAEKIKYMLQHPQAAAAMGERARRKILANYELENLAAQNLSFFRQLTQKNV